MILAAGFSRRFGADKLLASLTLAGDTAPLLVHSLRPWLQVFDRVSLVVRPQCGLREAVGDLPSVDWVVAEQAALGMGHSLAAGVAANGDAAGWLVGLADMPLLPVSAIAGVRSLLEAGAPLAAPDYAGRRGHPVAFAASYRDELLALQGDAGARQIVQRDAQRLQSFAINAVGVLTDIDVPADLQQTQDTGA